MNVKRNDNENRSRNWASLENSSVKNYWKFIHDTRNPEATSKHVKRNPQWINSFPNQCE